jgi:hypothetical protein
MGRSTQPRNHDEGKTSGRHGVGTCCVRHNCGRCHEGGGQRRLLPVLQVRPSSTGGPRMPVRRLIFYEGHQEHRIAKPENVTSALRIVTDGDRATFLRITASVIRVARSIVCVAPIALPEDAAANRRVDAAGCGERGGQTSRASSICGRVVYLHRRTSPCARLRKQRSGAPR